VRAKFVFEKFTENSDPVHDMGIGMYGMIRNWVKKDFNLSDKELYNITDETFLIASTLRNKLDFVKYLIKTRKVKIPDGLISQAINNKANTDIILYLITAGNEKSFDYVKKRMKKL